MPVPFGGPVVNLESRHLAAVPVVGEKSQHIPLHTPHCTAAPAAVAGLELLLPLPPSQLRLAPSSRRRSCRPRLLHCAISFSALSAEFGRLPSTATFVSTLPPLPQVDAA